MSSDWLADMNIFFNLKTLDNPSLTPTGWCEKKCTTTIILHGASGQLIRRPAVTRGKKISPCCNWSPRERKRKKNEEQQILNSSQKKLQANPIVVDKVHWYEYSPPSPLTPRLALEQYDLYGARAIE